MFPMTTTIQGEVHALYLEFKAYIKALQIDWLRENRPESRDVYEVMSNHDRREVHNCIRRWEEYVTPIAEAWWRERGYGVVWPDDNSQAMQVYRLEDA